MKKQNGISQIFIMVVMLILAIALPITANLVKKVQDNRSSAAAINCSILGIADCASHPSACTWTGVGTLYSAGVCKDKPASSDFVGCVDGTSRCDGEYYRFCISGYENKIFCDYGCSAGVCKPAPITGSTGTNTGGVFTAVNAAPGTYKTSKLGSYGEKFDTGICKSMGGYCNYYQSSPSAGTTCVGINYSDSGIVVGTISTGKCIKISTANLPDGLTSGQIRCCSGTAAPVSQPVTVVVPSTPGCTATTGTNGSCGAAAGTMHWTDGTAPTTTNLMTQNPLCADGSKPTVNTNADYTYTWTCGGGEGTCGGANGGTASCTAYWLNCNDLNYWSMYPDVKNAELRPWSHYQNYGQPEGRTWPTSGSTPFCWEGTKKITCGNVETGPNDTCGTKPAPIVCTPNCACATNTLVGQTCSNGCDGTCAGNKVAPVAPTPTPTQIACGDNELSGSNHADEIDKDFEMGRNSGHFTFTWRLYAVPDRVQVFYENTLLFDKTDGNSDYKSVVLSYGPGTSTKIHVHIIPDVTAPLWYYKISCAVPGITPTPTPTPTPVCTAGAKQCSGTNLQTCNGNGSGWDFTTDCGAIGCNSTTKTCNVCTNGDQKCSTANNYSTCTGGVWPSSLTNCASGKVCTNGATSTAVCKDPDYTAPRLNMFFAISGVKKIDTCFGDLKFKISITKNGSSVATTNEITATVVDNKFNTKFGDQVFKITDFALTNDYALTDKIKITVGSSRKILATIYGKDNQASGFPALNNSTILVSDLVGNTLNFYEYPVLNGDIGKEGSLGTVDNVVNGFDFAFMKSEWGKTCSAGQNLNADLNGDCRVDTFDLQILKNAMAEQLAQKTD